MAKKESIKSDIGKVYVNDAKKMIVELLNSLKKLEYNLENKEALNELIHSSHTLKGNSLQMGFFAVGYLAQQIKDWAHDIREHGKKLQKVDLIFLKDIAGSLEKALDVELEGGKFQMSKKLMEKMDISSESDYNKKKMLSGSNNKPNNKNKSNNNSNKKSGGK